MISELKEEGYDVDAPFGNEYSACWPLWVSVFITICYRKIAWEVRMERGVLFHKELMQYYVYLAEKSQIEF